MNDRMAGKQARPADVTECIAALRAGQMSLDEVAARFRQRTWPTTRRGAPATYREMAEQQDVEADVPGSYDDVTAAYDRGELTSEEYRVLSDAIAAAINAAPLWRQPQTGQPDSGGCEVEATARQPHTGQPDSAGS